LKIWAYVSLTKYLRSTTCHGLTQDNLYRIGTWPWPITWPFVIWRCVHKCKNKCKYENEDGYAGNGGDYDDEDGNKDTILHFASMLQANGTDEVDMEKLKEALDMDMDMDMVD
jgi:hypothetical protein